MVRVCIIPQNAACKIQAFQRNRLILLLSLSLLCNLRPPHAVRKTTITITIPTTIARQCLGMSTAKSTNIAVAVAVAVAAAAVAAAAAAAVVVLAIVAVIVPVVLAVVTVAVVIVVVAVAAAAIHLIPV